MTHLYNTGVLFDNTAIAGKVYGCKFSDLGGADTANPQLAVAIMVEGGVRAEKNTLDTASGSNGNPSIGIYALGSGGDFAIGNTIANYDYGLISCTYLNNLTTNVPDDTFLGGTAATGNTSVENN